MLPTRDPPQNTRPIETEVKCWKKYSTQLDRRKRAGVAILISDKMDFKTSTIKRDPEGHFIVLKGRIHQEDRSR